MLPDHGFRNFPFPCAAPPVEMRLRKGFRSTVGGRRLSGKLGGAGAAQAQDLNIGAPTPSSANEGNSGTSNYAFPGSLPRFVPDDVRYGVCFSSGSTGENHAVRGSDFLVIKGGVPQEEDKARCAYGVIRVGRAQPATGETIGIRERRRGAPPAARSAIATAVHRRTWTGSPGPRRSHIPRRPSGRCRRIARALRRFSTRCLPTGSEWTPFHSGQTGHR